MTATGYSIEGRLIVEVAVAVLHPAEFVILRLMPSRA